MKGSPITISSACKELSTMVKTFLSCLCPMLSRKIRRLTYFLKSEPRRRDTTSSTERRSRRAHPGLPPTLSAEERIFCVGAANVLVSLRRPKTGQISAQFLRRACWRSVQMRTQRASDSRLAAPGKQTASPVTPPCAWRGDMAFPDPSSTPTGPEAALRQTPSAGSASPCSS